MKRSLIFLIVLLINFHLALAAVTVQTDATEYSRPATVSFTVNCPGSSTIDLRNANGDLLYVSLGVNSWTNTYNTASDSNDGKYSLSASCEDGTTAIANFCVNSPNCLAVAGGESVPPAVPVTPPSSGGGGRRCSSNWRCDNFWSYCNASLQQSRRCVDLEACDPRKTIKYELKSCSLCDESWVCTVWTSCTNGQQARQCADEHYCGTIAKKPELQKSCSLPIPPGPAPVRVVQQLPPVMPPPAVQQPAPPSSWEQYKAFIVGLALGVIVLGALGGLIYHFARPKQMAYNIGELKEWIRKERAAGTSDQGIKDILVQNTGWRQKEIEEAFAELK